MPGAAACCGMRVNISRHSGCINSGTCIDGTYYIPATNFHSLIFLCRQRVESSAGSVAKAVRGDFVCISKMR